MARRHPEYAERLRRLLPALVMMADFRDSSPRELEGIDASGPGLGVLGDFRIIREVGRGGMGIVYEAQQISLDRRVALKVLPMAAALDGKQLKRFQLEAHAAACLHHTNIVPVHAVGCERGVPFYAMQFIEGRSLAQLIGELRRLAAPVRTGPPRADLADISISTLAAGLLSGRFSRALAAAAPAEPGPDTPVPPASPPDPADPTAPVSRPGEPPSGSATRTRAFIRTVVQLGVQVAEALDHAHARGILHRDIKPANLLLDDHGQLWVADFGLAQIQGNPCLTLTGDVLGTLRYMSPEQALAKRVVIDGRTDLYSLGVTLFELLTLRPAIEGQDRQEILRKIAQEEPPPLRELNPAVPRDLETIVLKAMAKEPSGRYATARELADELRRFLENKPIAARRPSLRDRAAKWAVRHRPVVWSAGLSLAVLLLMTVFGLAMSNWLVTREKDRKDAALREKAQALQERGIALATAEANEKAARANLRLARKAVDELYTQLAEEMEDLPRMQPLQRKFLLQALEFYKEFATQQSTDPETRFEMGLRLSPRRRKSSTDWANPRRRGERRSSRWHCSKGWWRNSPTRLATGPNWRRATSPLVRTLPGSAELSREATLPACATSLMELLVATSPTVPDYQRRLSSAYRNLGVLPGLPVPEAEQAIQSAIRIGRKLVADHPEEPSSATSWPTATSTWALSWPPRNGTRRPRTPSARRSRLVNRRRTPPTYPAGSSSPRCIPRSASS